MDNLNYDQLQTLVLIISALLFISSGWSVVLYMILKGKIEQVEYLRVENLKLKTNLDYVELKLLQEEGVKDGRIN